MAFDADPIELTEEERRELEQMTQSRMLPAGDVMRARMILMLSDRVPYRRIQDLLQTTMGSAGTMLGSQPCFDPTDGQIEWVSFSDGHKTSL